MSNPAPIPAKLAHDLMNHLGVALGRADLMLIELADDDPLRESVQEVRDACQRAIDLVNASRAPVERGL